MLKKYLLTPFDEIILILKSNNPALETCLKDMKEMQKKGQNFSPQIKLTNCIFSLQKKTGETITEVKLLLKKNFIPLEQVKALIFWISSNYNEIYSQNNFLLINFYYSEALKNDKKFFEASKFIMDKKKLHENSCKILFYFKEVLHLIESLNQENTIEKIFSFNDKMLNKLQEFKKSVEK